MMCLQDCFIFHEHVFQNKQLVSRRRERERERVALVEVTYNLPQLQNELNNNILTDRHNVTLARRRAINLLKQPTTRHESSLHTREMMAPLEMMYGVFSVSYHHSLVSIRDSKNK